MLNILLLMIFITMLYVFKQGEVYVYITMYCNIYFLNIAIYCNTVSVPKRIVPPPQRGLSFAFSPIAVIYFSP